MTAEIALKRTVGLLHSVGFGLGAMIGTGVFVYTAVAAGIAGPAMLVSLAIAGLAATCNGLSSSQLAANFPRSGAAYEYATRMLSPWAGFVAGWLFLAAKTTSAAATALGLGLYLAPTLHVPPLAIALPLVALVTLLNLFRLTGAGMVNLALLAVTLVSLVGFVAAGWPHASADRLTPFAPHGVRAILTAAALLFVAYAGYGRVATLGEEVLEPRRTIPLAIVLSIAIGGLLYAAVSFVAIGSIGAPAFAEAGTLQRAAPGRVVRLGLTVGAATALGAVFLNLMLGLSRMVFAMARGGDLPGALARTNAASSPVGGVLFTGAVVGALVASRDLVALVSLSAFTILTYYGLTHLAALRLRREQRLLHPAVAVIGLLFCVALAASVPLRSLAMGAGILLAGALWRVAWRAISAAGAASSAR